MSIDSSNHPTPDLYCSEVTSEVIHLDSDESLKFHFLWEDSDSDSEGSCLLSLLESEHDQVPEQRKSLRQLRKKTWLINAREEAIHWILKVHSYYNFRPETAYLSVNYLDRFLLSHSLTEDSAWPMQLLSVACLSLAAKMEETKVPLLLDLQVIESKFLFKPKTVQRMELLVMASLKWRLRTITPFDFIHLFIAKLSCSASRWRDLSYIVSRVSDVIIRTCLVMDFSEFSPSTIAAAALLWVTNQRIDDKKPDCFHKHISIEMVHTCYKLMKQKLIIRRSEFFWSKTSQLLPRSPTCVLDHAAMQESSDALKP
ncbi:cyclin-D1-1 [Cajanus cajan]|uniref:B-like cyclin n=1 Tax=Cajanus cajan TaxID=3821 RepID=A0A151SE48_CAJCA|nr:cyclin-D1-1 [Cajanus cajan]KYP53102.1 Cyclin-D1-1 [Cajanus cajan]